MGGSSALLHLEVKRSTSLAFRNRLLRVRACRARQRNTLLPIHSSRLRSFSEALQLYLRVKNQDVAFSLPVHGQRCQWVLPLQ